jgi:hypothetical protein
MNNLGDVVGEYGVDGADLVLSFLRAADGQLMRPD